MINIVFPKRRKFWIAIATAVALLSACSQSNEPVAMHLQASEYQPEHDEVVSQNTITDYYPNRQHPQEVVFHRLSGGMLDAQCMDSGCDQILLTISGSKTIPNGSYQLVKTDDPNIIAIRDKEGARILGYLARNNGGGKPQFFPDLDKARQFEHKGDAARTAGKIALGALLVAALAAIVVGTAAAEADANRTTTRCTTVGESTTCSTY